MAKKYTIASFVILILVSIPLEAQIVNSMYFMPGVPQSNRINPSVQPSCRFYLGFPGLAPLRFQISSSSLAFNDIVYYNSDIDSLITAFHPLGNKQAFLNNLQDVNYILSNLGTSIASLGFGVKKSYFSFDITTRADGNLYYPKGIFEFLFNGAPDGGTISLGGLGIDLNVFNEFSMGWSRKDFFIPNLDIGLRGKMLFGLANVATKKSQFDISTSLDSWDINTHMQVNAAAPSFVTFNSDLESSPVSVDENFFNTATPFDIVSNVFSLDQFGLALDAGVSYRPFEELLISASVMDIGGIRWNNTVEGTIDFDYNFKGIELAPFSDQENTFLQDLTDSVMNSFSVVAGQPYISTLNTKVFAGVSYYPIEKIGFGLLSRTDFLNNKISQQFTGSVNMTTGKFINLTMSYSYLSRTFNNLGAGLSFNVGPFNMYLISDNIVSGALNPLNTRSVNLWFGMNLTFGWKKATKKEVMYDRPLIL